MDESSDSRFWSKLRNIFKKNGHALEEHILDAQGEGELKDEDVSMLLNVLDLSDTTVADIMVPRTDIVCAEADSDVKDIARLIIENGHSRIPIFQENRDQMVGIVHAKDLLHFLMADAETPPKASAIMRETIFVPETTNVKSLLRSFQTRQVHLAIVLDEYAGTSGLVTLEDVLEEIVGEIEDEYDVHRPDDVQVLEDGALLVSGRTELEELADEHGLPLASQMVDTIGGYVSQHAGRIPAAGEIFELDDRRFTIREADAKQVRTILIEPLSGPEQTD